jgi:hypothetical protein
VAVASGLNSPQVSAHTTPQKVTQPISDSSMPAPKFSPWAIASPHTTHASPAHAPTPAPSQPASTPAHVHAAATPIIPPALAKHFTVTPTHGLQVHSAPHAWSWTASPQPEPDHHDASGGPESSNSTDEETEDKERVFHFIPLYPYWEELA